MGKSKNTTSLFFADEDIKSSYIYIGYLILRKLRSKKENKISIFDLTAILKQDLKIVHYRQLVFALVFLNILGLIDFIAPYIYNASQVHEN